VTLAAALLLAAPAGSQPPPSPQDLAGTWYSDFGYMELEVEGDQIHGNQVHGTYSCCRGRLEGTLGSKRLELSWQDEIYGEGWVFLYPQDGGQRLEGVFGKQGDFSSGGQWNAVRIPELDTAGPPQRFRVSARHPRFGQLEGTVLLDLSGDEKDESKEIRGELRGHYRLEAHGKPFRYEMLNVLTGRWEDGGIVLTWTDPVRLRQGEIRLRPVGGGNGEDGDPGGTWVGTWHPHLTIDRDEPFKLVPTSGRAFGAGAFPGPPFRLRAPAISCGRPRLGGSRGLLRQDLGGIVSVRHGLGGSGVCRMSPTLVSARRASIRLVSATPRHHRRVSFMGKGSRETAALRTLRNLVQKTLLHMELVDASLLLTGQTVGQAKDKRQSLLKAMPIHGKYESLHLPAKQHQQLVNEARGHNLEMALVRLYRGFIEYFRSVLHAVHRNRPLEMVRDAAVDLDPAEAAAADGEEALRELHFVHAFRNLEVRGNAELLVTRVIEETGVSIDEPVQKEALMFLEMRNLYVYNGGTVDDRYARSFGEELRVKPGGRLPRNIKLGRRAMRAVEKLCLDLDSGLLKNRLLKAG